MMCNVESFSGAWQYYLQAPSSLLFIVNALPYISSSRTEKPHDYFEEEAADAISAFFTSSKTSSRTCAFVSFAIQSAGMDSMP